jgi:peptidoglycan/LPS O-acetylase OafA/YrhL
MLSLSIGALVAYYEPAVRNLSPKRWTIMLFLVPVFLYLGTVQRDVNIGSLLISRLTFMLICFSIVSVLLLMVVIRLNGFEPSSLPGKLRFPVMNPVTQYIGKISYGMYLYHFPILFFLGLTPDDVIGLPKVLLLILLFVGVPALSFQLIESPLLALKKKLTNRS